MENFSNFLLPTILHVMKGIIGRLHKTTGSNFLQVTQYLLKLRSLMWINFPTSCNYTQINRTQLLRLRAHLHFISLAHFSGHVFGIGRVNVLIATPYATERESKPLYGISPVSNSQRSTE